MPVKIENAEVIPAITMDKLHVDLFSIRHARENDPKRVVDIVGTLYGVDSNGNKRFSDKTMSQTCQDFDAAVVTKWLTDNPGKTLENFAMAHIAKKQAVNNAYKNGEIDILDLMAYFELAVGVVFNLLNVTDSIDGLE